MKNKNHNFLLENLYSFHKAFSQNIFQLKKNIERKMNILISFNSIFFLLNRIFYIIHKILYEKFSGKNSFP